jgi:hypothetical protein
LGVNKKVRSKYCCAQNSCCWGYACAGAVGTPIWFGFGELGLGDANLQLVGVKASILVGACAFVIAPLAASFLVSRLSLQLQLTRGAA